MSRDSTNSDAGVTRLAVVLLVAFMASLGTGVFWHGLAFIAKHAYDFGQTRNLALYAVNGAIYTAGAFGAGRVTRALERWLSPRAVLASSIAVQAAVCVLPVVVPDEWALWLTAAVISYTSSLVWPLVESYVTAGRHGPEMRKAIARFNFTWMPATVLPLFVMAPILEHHGQWAIGGLAFTGAVALVPLAGFARFPAAHHAEAAAEHVGDRYPDLLRCSRVLLPASYMLTSVMAPILPYRFEQIGVDVAWETPSTATWMIVRLVAVVVMWRLPFWHGRWGTLLLAGVTMTGGFALVILARTLPVMLVGFAGMGVGIGVVYYAALYYAMAVGRAEVDAGGTHEGLIGVGYAVGPLAGLAGTALGAGTRLGGGTAIVGVVWALVAVAAVAAVRPYARSRGRRR